MVLMDKHAFLTIYNIAITSKNYKKVSKYQFNIDYLNYYYCYGL